MRPTAAGDPPYRADGASVMVNWTFLREVEYGRWLVRTAIRQAANAWSGRNALRLPVQDALPVAASSRRALRRTDHQMIVLVSTVLTSGGSLGVVHRHGVQPDAGRS
jgi:hypothetical protein